MLQVFLPSSLPTSRVRAGYSLVNQVNPLRPWMVGHPAPWGQRSLTRAGEGTETFIPARLRTDSPIPPAAIC